MKGGGLSARLARTQAATSVCGWGVEGWGVRGHFQPAGVPSPWKVHASPSGVGVQRPDELEAKMSSPRIT